MTRVHTPDDSPQTGPVFAGHVVVFTGKLSSLGRKEARALVERLGGVAADEVTSRTTMLVVGAEGFPRGAGRPAGAVDEADKSHKLRKAEQVNARAPGSVRILSEEDFCRLGGLPSAGALKQQFYALRDIRELYAAVREDHVRYLEKWGLICPVVRTNAETYYHFADLLVIKQAAAELGEGAPFRAVLRSLVAAREGQLAFDFRPGRSDAQPAKVVALERRAPAAPPDVSDVRQPSADAQTALAARYFLEGSALDEGDEAALDQAMAAYRKALVLDPTLVPALVNLANIHYAHDELIEAQALYERAIGLEPDCFEAHYNLGNIHHDLGRYAEAQVCYGEALALNPGCADAHFYLAVTLEKTGRSQDAKPHWRAYQQLAPDGEWVELAREFSD